ncbi:MAG: hypothetical protein JWM35_2100, partial [Verrucomicrobia bacterium]|nr:hypothetical protein [Verrucomicrobiota bacterium]
MLSLPGLAVFRACIVGFISLVSTAAVVIGAEAQELSPQTLAKAKSGDAQAQYEVGMFYAMGSALKDFRPRDADEWLRKAAGQNHLGAILLLIDLDA